MNQWDLAADGSLPTIDHELCTEVCTWQVGKSVLATALIVDRWESMGSVAVDDLNTS